MRRVLGYVAATWLTAAPVLAVDPVDLTTIGGLESRYLVNLGQGWGDTIVTAQGRESGLYDFSNAGGYGWAWWVMNDGVTDLSTSGSCDTFLGMNPDYFGYKFKLPATVTSVDFWNRCYADGGTFAATPEVQYLDAVQGTWHTASATCTPTYDPLYVANSIRHYTFTLNPPVSAVWGIRLIGDASITPGAGANAAADGGFLGLTELTLHGNLEVAPLDLTNNLAHAPDATAIAIRGCCSPLSTLIDGNLNTGFDTWAAGATGEDWVGITWSTPQSNVAAMGMVFGHYFDGGMFDECGGSFRIETTADGSTWTAVTGLDKGRLATDYKELRWRPWRPHTGYLFRFNPVSNITGIRIIGDPAGFSADRDGFIVAYEMDVFANAAGLVQNAKSFWPTLGELASNGLHQAWNRILN